MGKGTQINSALSLSLIPFSKPNLLNGGGEDGGESGTILLPGHFIF